MKELKIDSEFQALIPSLSGEEFSQLEENVKLDGCRDALVVWQGIIVDGHNRYKICRETNISFRMEEKDFADRDTAVEWIIRNQFGRRNLSPAQRCELAMKLKPRIQEHAKENQRKSGGAVPTKSSKPVDTRKELAKIAGVSEDTLAKTEKIFQKGTPEQIDRVRKGGKGNSVNAIHNEVIGKRDTTEEKAVDSSPQVPVNSFRMSEHLYQQLAGVKPKCERLTKDEKELAKKELEDLRNPNRIVEDSIEDVISDLKTVLEIHLNSLEGALRRHIHFLRNKDDNIKIMAVLSEAVTTMGEWKGKYSYEKL